MKRSQNWLEHALRRRGWAPQRQVIALASLGFFIALILGGLYLSQVVSDATTNRRLTELLEDRDELERVNEQLRADIARLQSVPRLQERAREMGFELADQSRIEYMVVRGYHPVQVDTVAPVEVEEAPEPVYTETFTDWLGSQWDRLRSALGGG